MHVLLANDRSLGVVGPWDDGQWWRVGKLLGLEGPLLSSAARDALALSEQSFCRDGVTVPGKDKFKFASRYNTYTKL